MSLITKRHLPRIEKTELGFTTGKADLKAPHKYLHMIQSSAVKSVPPIKTIGMTVKYELFCEDQYTLTIE